MLNLSITYTLQNGILTANVSEIEAQIPSVNEGQAKIVLTKDITELGFRKTEKPFQRLIEVDGVKHVAVITPKYLG